MRNAGTMLAYCLRRRANIGPTLGRHPVLAGYSLYYIDYLYAKRRHSDLRDYMQRGFT